MHWSDTSGDPAAAYARGLLGSHAVDAEVPEPDVRRTPVEDWAASGAMALTGTSDGPPELVAGAPATTARGTLVALAAVASAAGLDSTRLPDERLLSERAALMGLRRAGRISPGGASRLLDAADGTVAVTLSRAADFAAIPALLSQDVAGDPWAAVARWCRGQTTIEVVERASLLGLAVGVVDHCLPAATTTPPGRPRRPSVATQPPLVVDLSSLWAGPLCAHLLGTVGARVIHVESARRPDPIRESAPAFHQLLRGDAERIVLDFTVTDELSRLRDLLLSADVVIEASRPRALAQLGIDADSIVAESGACTWVSITAYGRASNRIGYGDDVAAAAGLVGTGRVFAGDALADPLTGTHAAVAALAGWSTRSSAIVEVPMYDVARAARIATPQAEVVRPSEQWLVDVGGRLIPVRDPSVRESALGHVML